MALRDREPPCCLSGGPERRLRGVRDSVAALLSFLWPGLGQLYTGRRRLAIAFAVPAVLVLLVVIYQMRQGLLVFGRGSSVHASLSPPS